MKTSTHGPRLAAGAAAAVVGGVLLGLCAGCYTPSRSEGGGQVRADLPRQANPADVLLPPGYRIEAVATGLTYPTGIAFDDQGRPHVTESGYVYGEQSLTPRLLRIDPGGSTAVVATGDKDRGPWNGVDFRDGAFYVAEGGAAGGGRILRLAPDGK